MDDRPGAVGVMSAFPTNPTAKEAADDRAPSANIPCVASQGRPDHDRSSRSARAIPPQTVVPKIRRVQPLKGRLRPALRAHCWTDRAAGPDTTRARNTRLTRRALQHAPHKTRWNHPRFVEIPPRSWRRSWRHCSREMPYPNDASSVGRYGRSTGLQQGWCGAHRVGVRADGRCDRSRVRHACGHVWEFG